MIPYGAKKLPKYSGKMGAVGSAFYLDPEYTYIRREKERNFCTHSRGD